MLDVLKDVASQLLAETTRRLLLSVVGGSEVGLSGKLRENGPGDIACLRPPAVLPRGFGDVGTRLDRENPEEFEFVDGDERFDDIAIAVEDGVHGIGQVARMLPSESRDDVRIKAHRGDDLG